MSRCEPTGPLTHDLTFPELVEIAIERQGGDMESIAASMRTLLNGLELHFEEGLTPCIAVQALRDWHLPDLLESCRKGPRGVTGGVP